MVPPHDATALQLREEEPTPAATAARSATDLTAYLRARFASTDYQAPLLPAVAVELLELSQRPGVELDQVSAVLERDPMLAGRVLRMVQSPVYAGRAPIRSLKQAVVRLGLARLRDLLLEVVMSNRMFRAGAYATPLEQLRKHSTATAYLSRIICYYTAMEGEYAFLCGLLHDVGVAAALLVLGELGREPQGDLQPVWAGIEPVHEEAGVTLARLWKLPTDIQLVLGHHHRVEVDGVPHPLSSTLCIAQQLAFEMGAGVPFFDPDPRGNVLEAREALRISDRMMELIRTEGRELLARLADSTPS